MKRFLNSLSQRQDIILIGLLMTIVVVMIIPLPTPLIDLLIATNLSLTMMVLVVAVYLKRPEEFSALPAVILIATTFRLAITISTTRLILAQANAGAIIDTFGNFVTRGSLVVGLVIFLIITTVQFLVITKGSERVAEVAARFSLDGMPGRQMSIDAELRNGRHHCGRSAAAPHPARKGESVLRRHGRRDEIRQGRCHCRADHCRHQSHRRHRRRLALQGHADRGRAQRLFAAYGR